MEAGWRGRDFGVQLERGEPSPEGGMGSIWGVHSRTPSEVLKGPGCGLLSPRLSCPDSFSFALNELESSKRKYNGVKDKSQSAPSVNKIEFSKGRFL